MVDLKKKIVTTEQESSLHSLFGIEVVGLRFETLTFLAMASSYVQTLLSVIELDLEYRTSFLLCSFLVLDDANKL